MSWGAIFDFDGVIIDSAAYHEKAWDVIAKEEKKVLPLGHFKKGFGMKNRYIIPNILHWTSDSEEVERLSDRKEEIYREIVMGEGIDPLPGVLNWLEELKKAGIPCVIGSSADRLNVEMILDAIGLREFFVGWVTSKDVKAGKPDPEVFLKCAEKINVSPRNCLVFEDAFAGIEAAKAGGMRVVGVATTHSKEALKEAQADFIVDRLDELDIDKVM